MKNNEKSFFIATAMSNLSKDEYKNLQNSVKNIKIKYPKNKIFSEITTIKDHNSFMTPKEATELDISEIKKASHFILIHLSDIQSSTLFELGLAYSLEKEIIIFYKDKNDLPFMLKELNLVSNYVKLIKIKNLEDEVILESFK